MSNKIEFERVSNGWILRMPGVDEYGFPSDCTAVQVFEDVERDASLSTSEHSPAAESLANALWEAFSGYTQTKHSAGLSFEVRPSRTKEEHEDL
jgi:hypothetical protein